MQILYGLQCSQCGSHLTPSQSYYPFRGYQVTCMFVFPGGTIIILSLLRVQPFFFLFVLCLLVNMPLVIGMPVNMPFVIGMPGFLFYDHIILPKTL